MRDRIKIPSNFNLSSSDSTSDEVLLFVLRTSAFLFIINWVISAAVYTWLVSNHCLHRVYLSHLHRYNYTEPGGLTTFYFFSFLFLIVFLFLSGITIYITRGRYHFCFFLAYSFVYLADYRTII